MLPIEMSVLRALLCRKLNEPYELNRLSTNICAPRSVYKLNLVKRLFSLYKNLSNAAFHDSMRILLYNRDFNIPNFNCLREVRSIFTSKTYRLI